MSIITCNALLPYANPAPPISPAAGVLAKLVSWYDFNDNLEDSWGPFPLVTGGSTPSYANASDYGPLVSGRCITAGGAESMPVLPNYSGQLIGAAALTSCAVAFSAADLFRFSAVSVRQNSDNGPAFGGRVIASSLDGYNVNPAATSSDAVLTWHLTSVDMSLSPPYATLNKDGNFSVSVDAGGLPGYSIDSALRKISYTSGGSAVASAAFAYLGPFTSLEWAYLWNSGAGRSLGQVLSDAAYVRPATRMQESLGLGAALAFSYDGRKVARRAPASTAVTYLGAATTSRNTGKRWFVMRVNSLIEDSFFSAAYVATTDFASSYVGLKFSLTGGPATDLGGSFVQVAPFNAGCNPGDYLSFAIDFDAGKLWVNKSAPPDTAGVETFTFTPNLALMPGLVLQHLGLLTYSFYTGQMPTADPVGFLPWGD